MWSNQVIILQLVALQQKDCDTVASLLEGNHLEAKCCLLFRLLEGAKKRFRH